LDLAKYGHKFDSTANKEMFNRGEISLKILEEFGIKTVITPKQVSLATGFGGGKLISISIL
jgi:hypothetical protein